MVLQIKESLTQPSLLWGGVKSFPTTAFIPIEGDPVIHSGFSGPATGDSYEEEVVFFRNTIESLIRESR